MPFVKLDTGILDSTLWIDRESREIFLTSLLMAQPWEFTEPQSAIAVRSLDDATGFSVPPGWYGFVRAAGPGIVRRAGLDPDAGLDALERLGEIDAQSRTAAFEGRRMVRISGGFVILNYMLYRDRDDSAERQRRYRERQKKIKESSRVTVTPSRRDRDAIEGEAEGEKSKSIASSLRDAAVDVPPTDAENRVDLLGHKTTPKKGKWREPCPISTILNLYHELLPECPKVYKLTAARRAQIQARWRDDLTDLDDWRFYFGRVRSEPFYLGKNDRQWRASLEWLTKDGNFARVMERLDARKPKRE